ncbi:hypothetical protein PUN28_014050 [Cardiocondyla obscurior]|uniref:Uncharacterized protein n=1 Tax=Cardiocondyla obscurior TaxID=286306 RepID=A0AAW2FA52_9HYME
MIGTYLDRVSFNVTVFPVASEIETHVMQNARVSQRRRFIAPGHRKGIFDCQELPRKDLRHSSNFISNALKGQYFGLIFFARNRCDKFLDHAMTSPRVNFQMK